MEQQTWISADVFCTHYHVELSLVRAIGEYGLVEVATEGDQVMIAIDHLADLERVLRLHDDLGINLEGIEAINFLLERVRELQAENRELRKRLRDPGGPDVPGGPGGPGSPDA